MTGTLYIVATPIGNLEDITFRAVRVLKEAGRIACEDTRQTHKLLEHYGISTPTVSYHDHNEQARSDQLIQDLEAGQNIALVTDAGTPLIADPGYRIVQKARERGIPVIPIPGPSAVITALSGCGLPVDSFAFLGFLPPKTGQRKKALQESRELGLTVVFYETPHRIVEALGDMREVLGDPAVVVARELTKLHEEWLSGSASEVQAVLAKRGSVRGEFVVIVGKSEAPVPSDLSVEEEVEALVQSGVPKMDALKQVARRRGLSKREVYKKSL